MKSLRLLFISLSLLTALASFSEDKVLFLYNPEVESPKIRIPGSDLRYYVLEYPGLTKHELFNRVKIACNDILDKNFNIWFPDWCGEVNDEFMNTSINVTDGDIQFIATFKFKDGKIRVDCPVGRVKNGTLTRAHVREFNRAINKILEHVETQHDW